MMTTILRMLTAHPTSVALFVPNVSLGLFSSLIWVASMDSLPPWVDAYFETNLFWTDDAAIDKLSPSVLRAFSTNGILLITSSRSIVDARLPRGCRRTTRSS